MIARVMTRCRSGVCAGLYALLFAGWAMCAQAITTNVSVTAVTTFSPSAVTIKPSDTVQWTWSGNNHSTTSQSTPVLWDSGIHNSPFTFSFTFTNQGFYPYHCSNPLHTSMTGSVTVTNRPPVVTVTNPPNGSIFTAPASFTLGATASDPDGAVSQVEFFQNSTSLGVDTTSPYGVSVSGLAAGSYTFSAVATGDGNGKATNSISVTVNAANALPTVTVTNPVNGTVFSAPATFTIGATASDDGTVTNVQFLLGAAVVTNDTTSPYGAGVTNLGAGSYTISAIASDNLGAKATNSVGIIVNALPTVTVTNPANGAVFSAPATFVVGATASDSDGTVTNVQFLVGTTPITNDTTAPYGAGITNLSAGAYTFFAVASDNRGGKATNSINLSVVTPVAVVLSAPSRLSPTQFRFNYTGNTGLTYVVERSADLTGFFRVNTNVATVTNIVFTDGSATNPVNFYRVGRVPNP